MEQIIVLVIQGMREDDVLVCLFHQMWAGCYNAALSLPVSVPFSSLPAQQAQKLIQHGVEPFRFSKQTMHDIDHAIKVFAVRQALQCRPENLNPEAQDPASNLAQRSHNGRAISWSIPLCFRARFLPILGMFFRRENP